mmetsp:Transcript_15944/g.43410  ORF Transcript_15944/g.43410 Transcript_15944/m.43410 type:complete len:124 (-) Transcript_15944:2028-2399(-)
MHCNTHTCTKTRTHTQVHTQTYTHTKPRRTHVRGGWSLRSASHRDQAERHVHVHKDACMHTHPPYLLALCCNLAESTGDTGSTEWVTALGHTPPFTDLLSFCQMHSQADERQHSFQRVTKGIS